MTNVIDNAIWIDKNHLYRFVNESNAIEGIMCDPLDRELDAHIELLSLDTLSVAAIKKFVSSIQPNAVLRNQVGMDVRVGRYYPPPGHPLITRRLEILLNRINNNTINPYEAHQLYERLHPFTDGNGRSGRAIWLWHMIIHYKEGFVAFERGFLHSWYYQSLSQYRVDVPEDVDICS